MYKIQRRTTILKSGLALFVCYRERNIMEVLGFETLTRNIYTSFIYIILIYLIENGFAIDRVKRPS